MNSYYVRNMSKSPEQRFWEKVDKKSPDECWKWLSHITPAGYGNFSLKLDDGKFHVASAHRVSYELTYGDIPSGMEVCHTCDNRACVNPNHLFLGTQADNMKDMKSKNRQTGGIKNPRAKLTEESVREMRRLYSEGMSYKELAKKFSICWASVHNVVARRTWVGLT